ncbi:hypothetical protein CH333_05365 [candidate division WOR-3 bacterium JGI_Cruoil_03_44_89]|uniref:KAP NTPase domain-containing protein n=1 Tax=candidate division WOR-3 bacterium JGI_Cruoil_03_44_89 TaxID=1973748 RepID=A0A235BTQ2_UNCW3|nr:MAG: hypothetical protein CH333_05365 [candidate division WOR-3 bacterium JGI_Cruoil_03_44_89]
MKNSKFLEEKYGLKETVKGAFSDKIAREKQLEWWVDREEELEKWKYIIEHSLSTNKNYIVFIIGSYGRGKTLSLLKVKKEAMKYKAILPIYLNFKGEEKSKPGLDFILRIFKNIDFDKIREDKTDKEVKSAIENIPVTFEEPKKILNIIYFGKTGKLRYKPLFENESVQKREGKSEDSKLALFFLRGEIKPTTPQLKELEIIRKMENIDITKEYLAAVLYFIKNLRYKTLLLSVDEFEYLFSLVSKPQQSIYLAVLRSLYDFPSGVNVKPEDIVNMVFFIAISEDGWDRLKVMEKREMHQGGPIRPLIRRIDGETVLGRFDKEQSRKLIIVRLRYNRKKGKFEDNPLIPFTEDFVDYIHGVTEGEPSKIVVRCGHVLDKGLAERVPLLTREFAERVLEERTF